MRPGECTGSRLQCGASVGFLVTASALKRRRLLVWSRRSSRHQCRVESCPLWSGLTGMNAWQPLCTKMVFRTKRVLGWDQGVGHVHGGGPNVCKAPLGLRPVCVISYKRTRPWTNRIQYWMTCRVRTLWSRRFACILRVRIEDALQSHMLKKNCVRKTTLPAVGKINRVPQFQLV